MIAIGDWVISIGGADGMMVGGYPFQVTRIFEINGRIALLGKAPPVFGWINNGRGGYAVETRLPYQEYADRVCPAERNERGFYVAKSG